MTRYCWTDLRVLMKRLRDPETGCPWDLEQRFDTIAPFTLEEAYEVAMRLSVARWMSYPPNWGTCYFR